MANPWDVTDPGVVPDWLRSALCGQDDSAGSAGFRATKNWIDAGGNPNATHSHPYSTPESLLFMAVYAFNDAAVRLLLESGADATILEAVTFADGDHADPQVVHTPLCACVRGIGNVIKCEGEWDKCLLAKMLAMSKMLIDVGVDLDYVDSTDQRSALVWAAKTGNEDIVQLLVSRGADVSLCDAFGMDALFHAIMGITSADDDDETQGWTRIKNFLDNVVLQAGGWPAYVAAPRNNLFALRALVERGRASAPPGSVLERAFALPADVFRLVLASKRFETDIAPHITSRPW